MKRWISLLILLLFLVVCTHADTTSEVNPNTSKGWNQKAILLQKSGNYTEALAAADQAIELDTSNKYAWGTKASILTHLERYDEALTILYQATEIDPNDKQLWSMVDNLKSKFGVGNESSDGDLVKQANELQYTKKPDEALTVINQALDQDPNNTEAWKTKASILLKFTDREGAIKALNQSLRINPDDLDAWHTMAITYEKMNKHEDAIKAYDQEIRLNPTSNALNNKAYILQILGRYQEALTVVNQALELDPSNPYAQGTKNSILSHLK